MTKQDCARKVCEALAPMKDWEHQSARVWRSAAEQLVMPAIDKELRERIERWQAGGYADASPALVDALISALEAAAPAVALAAQIEEYNIVEFCDETNYGNTATCPECGGWSYNGHHDGCEWGATFKGYRESVAALAKRRGE